MPDEIIRNKYGETTFVSVQPPDRGAEDRAFEVPAVAAPAGTATQVADEFLRQNLPQMGLGDSHLASDENADENAMAADNPAEPVIQFSNERDIAGAKVVVYDQYVMGLPVFNARIGVDIDGSSMTATSAQSSMHGNIAVANPDQIRQPAVATRTPDSLKKLLGFELPSVDAVRFDRQVVYRYEAEERVEVPDDKHVGCFAGPPVPAYTLPAVPSSIREGSHYVVDDVLFRASRHQDEPPVNWRALVEPKSKAVLYLRALVANAAGMVMLRDPQVQTGTVVTGASSDAVLNSFRSSSTLRGIVNASPQQNLAGNFVRIGELTSPAIGSPVEPNPPAQFNYNVRTDNFSAANAYYHCDNCFRTMQDYGINVATFFNNTAFPITVDHRGLGNVVNANAPGNATGNGSGGFNFALLQAGQPIGIAASNGVVWHEFGHALLWDSVSSPNFGFAHSAGDSLAAIFHDPGSKAPDRFDTFPWVQAGTPLSRRHDRAVSAGWGWFGANYNTQYNGEQILSTTMFRFYRSIGGDATAHLASQTRASQATAFLIFKAVGTLTSTTPDPRVFVTRLENADKTTPAFKGIPGGALHKVIRWSFEKQGLFQPNAEPGMGNTVTKEGNPPDVDVYIDDGRHGEYQYQPNHWSCQDVWVRNAPDGGTTHQHPKVGVKNYMYVRVKNRGTQTANNVKVKGFQADPGMGLTFPDDFSAMATPILNASGPIPTGGSTVVGPFTYVPATVGHECLLAIASATGDAGNDTTITGSIPEHRLVPFDNNMGQRNVNPVFPSLRDLLKYFREHRIIVRNPLRKDVKYAIQVEMPKFLRKLGWSMKISSPGGATFEMGPRAARKVILNVVQGREFSAEVAKRAIAGGDGTIHVRAFVDGELAGGMSYALSFGSAGQGMTDVESEPADVESEPERPSAVSIEQILNLVGLKEKGEGKRRVKTIRIEFDLDEE